MELICLDRGRWTCYEIRRFYLTLYILHKQSFQTYIKADFANEGEMIVMKDQDSQDYAELLDLIGKGDSSIHDGMLIISIARNLIFFNFRDEQGKAASAFACGIGR